MKYIKKIILVVIICLIQIINVKAETNIPTLYEFDARVVNENGMTLKYSSEVIPYNTEIKVGKLGNKLYYNNEEINNISDIEIAKKEFDNSPYETLNNNIEVKIINPNGAYLYAGPSHFYDKIGDKIEANTKLKCVDSYTYGETFIYCDYNNTKGWLYVYNLDINGMDSAYVATKKEGSLYTLNSSYAEYEFPKKNDTKKVISQSKYSELNYSYVIKVGSTTWYYIDSLNGWILEENQSTADDSSKQGLLDKIDNQSLLVLSSRSLPIYKNLDFKDRENTLVENKSVVKILYIYYLISDGFSNYTNYYYIDCNGTKGWIKESDADKIILSTHGDKFLHIGNETVTYKDYDLSSNSKSSSIKYFDEVEGYEFEIYNGSTSSYMYYINLDNEYVWLKESTNKNMLTQINYPATVKSNVYLYENSDSSSKVKGAIKNNTYFKEIYSFEHYKNDTCTYYWKYVEYLNTSGWIHVSKCLDNVYDKLDEQEIISDEEVDNINKENNVYKVIEEEKEEEQEKNNLLLIIILFAIVIVLIIIVILIFMLKKNKNTVVYDIR